MSSLLDSHLRRSDDPYCGASVTSVSDKDGKAEADENLQPLIQHITASNERVGRRKVLAPYGGNFRVLPRYPPTD